MLEPLYLPRHVAALGESAAKRRSVRSAVGALYAVTPGAESDTASCIADERERGVDAVILVAAPGADVRAAAPPGERRAVYLQTAIETERGLASGPSAWWLDDGEDNVRALYDPFSRALLGFEEEAAFDRVSARLSASQVSGALGLGPAYVEEAGGSPAQALGFLLASALGWARELEARGVSLRAAASAMGAVVSPGLDVFASVAALRATCLAWAKLWARLGVEDVRGPLLVGVESARAMSELDAPTNMLRGSIEAFGLLAGGADVVAVRPYDEPLVGLAGASARGRTLARNTVIVLAEEAHVGRVADPAGGSYYVERLTEELARAGWAELQQIEKDGGIGSRGARAALRARSASAGAARAADVRKRKGVLVGVSDFAIGDASVLGGSAARAPGRVHLSPPQKNEENSDALAFVRDAAPFEDVRRRAAPLGPRALLFGLGEPADYRAREGFARRLFEVGGFTVSLADASGGACWVEDAMEREKPDAVMLCSSDAIYAASAAEVVARVKGAAVVALAGKPGALEEALRAAGLTHSVALGVDVPAWLDGVLERIERARSGGAR
ncbi:MAG: methylmalonyl-CoA mutase family protein [Polyangiaceae bacterium]